MGGSKQSNPSYTFRARQARPWTPAKSPSRISPAYSIPPGGRDDIGSFEEMSETESTDTAESQ